MDSTKEDPRARIGVREVILGIATSIAALLPGHKDSHSDGDNIQQSSKPFIQNVPGLPVETSGMKINYTPLPSSTATIAAVADAKVD